MAKDTDKLIADQAKQIAALKNQLAAKEAQSLSTQERQVDLSQKLSGLYSDLNTIKEEELKTEDKIARLTSLMAKRQGKQNKEADAQAKKMLATLQERKKGLDTIKEETQGYIDQGKALESHLKLLQKRQEFGEKYAESFEQSLEWVDDIDGAIKKIPIVGDFLSKAIGVDGFKEKLVDKFKEGFDSSAESADELANSVGGAIDATEGAASGAEAIGGGMKSSIPGALGLNAAMGPILLVALAIAAAVEMIKTALEVDQEVTDMAKGFGMTKEQAMGVHHEVLEISKETKVVGANTEALTEAYKELTAVTGQTNVATKSMLETQVLLTKQYGLTGEEAAAFQSTSAGVGQTAQQQLATVQQMVEGYNTMTGDSMNFKEISKDIAKVSKSTLASYKGDVKALTLAAIQAKKMGMSLEDAHGVSEKLLDVESSIEAEMKANVLTGKHMNMNKARQLAFDGDIAGAAAEAVKQAGSYDDLLKMRPMQQKAIADAAGMEVDQLLKAGELQKMSAALGGEQIKDMKDLTAEQIEQLKSSEAITAEKADQMLKEQQQASAQEKMSAATDKLKAVFVSMITPIMGIIDPIMSLVDTIMPALEVAMEIAFYPLKIAFGIVESLVKLIQGDLSGAWDAFTGGFSIFGMGEDDHGAAAGGGGEAGAEPMHDGMISGAGTVVKSPKGTYKLADEDTIIAGTELGSPGSGGEVLDALRDMLDKVKGISEDDLDDLEDLFDEVEDAFDELDVDELVAFASLAEQNLAGAGEALVKGINSLTGIDRQIDLDELEDTFDELEDALDELDFGDLVSFGQLAGSDLSGVGTALVEGINSLAGIKDDADLGGVEDAFDSLEDALDELSIEDLVEFMSLADKDLSGLGTNIGAGIKSLTEAITPSMADELEAIEDVFDQLEDVIAELDLEELQDFMALDFTPLQENANALHAGIQRLAEIGNIDLYALEDTFDLLEDAIDELDLDELGEFLELDLAKLSDIGKSEGGSGGSAAGKDPNAKVVSLLEQLIAKVDQPVNIKLGSRTIEEIGTQIGLRKSYSTRVDSGYGNV
jgi:hypothetical protein